MASSSTQPGAAENRSILTPVMTLEGHEPWKFPRSSDEDPEYKHASSISYSPDGKQMISGSYDKTVRRWDLREGKEIEEARVVCEDGIEAVGVSRDGRWVVTAGRKSLKVSEVETGIVRTFDEGNLIYCIDISADSTLLAGGSWFGTARIWNLDTGELVAGPFEYGDHPMGALRFSADSQKLAVMSLWGECLQVWDVQAQKLDVQRISTHKYGLLTSPVFWTTKNKSIRVIAVFSFIADDEPTMIYEFDASTLKTVGAPFKGHTHTITGLALSSDCVLLVSSSHYTIKLWAFESRQLLASFDVETHICRVVLSPDSRQLAYTSWDDCNIYICDIPADILANVGIVEEPQPSTNKSKRSRHAGLLNSDATRRPVSRKPAITPVMSFPRPMPTRDPHTFFHFLRKILPSSHANAVRPIGVDELHNPLDFPATHALPRPLIQSEENSQPTPAPPTTKSSVLNAPATLRSSLHRMSTWRPFQTDRASLAIVDVPLAPGKLRYATAGAPGDDDSVIRDEDYVSPAPSLNSGQHGNGRFCFCF